MKRPFLLFVILLLFSFISHAQNARLHIQTSHLDKDSVILVVFHKFLNRDLFKKGMITIHLDKKGSAIYTLPLKAPGYTTLAGGNFDSPGQYFDYTLFLSPGDDIYLHIDQNPKGFETTISGQGSENNPVDLITYRFDRDMSEFNGDTLPYRVMNAIRQQQHSNDSVITGFLAKHHPSAERVNNLRYESRYYPPQSYYSFRENNKFTIREVHDRNFLQWQTIQDSLFSTITLNNDTAFSAFNYIFLIRNFLTREKERLFKESLMHPEKFFREWYDTTVEAGAKLFQEDHANIPAEKIIEKNFKGRSAEFLYAIQLENAIDQDLPQNLVSVFERFKKKYPNSEYLPWITPYIDTVKMRQQQNLTDKMIFLPDNGTKIDSFGEVLAMAKGKTILLDMWGTWCGPCRSEIEKNSQAIKTRFAGKGLDYFYVANFDLLHERSWRNLIAYLHIEGTHILANSRLSNDIMTKVRSNGYPTYIIIKKDGSYQMSKVGYPMNRDLLFRQLETALAQ